MNKSPLLNTLAHIVENNWSFDLDIVELIFKKIQPEISNIHYPSFYYHDNFIVSGKLWSRVCFHSKITTNDNNLNNWKNLLIKYSPENLLQDKLVVNYNGAHEFSKNFFPVEVSSECLNLVIKGDHAFSITDVNKFTENEEIFISINILQAQQGHMYSLNIKNNSSYSEYLIELLIKNREKITNIFKLKEDVFLNKVLESSTLKKIISNIEPAKLLNLISDNDLRTIYKKASLQENAKNTPNMLNNLLPLATPEKWLNAYKNKKEFFNILSFFDNKFFLSTGKNINKVNTDKEKKYTSTGKLDRRGTRKELDTGDYSIKNEMLEEFKYLMPALKEQKIENNSIIQWYRAILRAEAADLLALSSQVVSIPSKDSADIDLKEYEALQKDLKFSKWNSDLNRNVPYYEIYSQGRSIGLADKMDTELKESPKTLKMKI